ncbi:hypothetical protein BDZ89DRAFT_1159984 [Hymenopellis radicata]|nr:hypothetical protein BDZ89DRAFT_1159984 [Hymenopellis radicata]
MPSQLVTIIFGAGSNVGDSVAHALVKQNYKVAVGSRNPKRDNVPEGFYPFTVDITKPDSIKTAFQTITLNWVPTNAEDPLSLPLSAYIQANSVTTSVYLAAQEALASFRSPIHSDSPKVFIVTGNLLAFIPAAPLTASYLVLGVQKRVEAYLAELLHNVYAKDGIRFHYAHLISADGGIPPPAEFAASGPAHAKAYSHLINVSTPESWDYRFTKDGEKSLRKQ